MIKMSVTYNGRPFDPKQFERDVMESAWTAATEHVEEKVRGLRCPIHFRSATVNRTAKGWTVESCCQTMKQAVEQRLRR